MHSASTEKLDNVYIDINDQTLSQWILATAKHEQAAFEYLYNATSAQVFGVLARLLRSEVRAEEALEDVYIKVWNQADTYQVQASAPRTWIVGIARNHAIADIAMRGPYEQPDTYPLESKPYIHQQDQSHALGLSLEHLDMETRACIVSAYCEGYTYEELSQKTQTPADAIKERIRNGLHTLKDHLDGLK